MAHPDKTRFLDRRRFLYLGGLSVLGGMLALSRPLVGSAVASNLVNQVPAVGVGNGLHLHNLHTGESLPGIIRSRGSYKTDTLSAVNQLLRDHRTGDVHQMDPALLDFLNGIADHLQVRPLFHVISGFRSQQTNQALRNQGRGVAKKSFHLLGQALDIRMPGVDVVQLHRAALALERGGVGLYRGQDFIHIDTGPVRSW